MNRNTAEAIALRITQTWRGGPSQTVWADVLQELDERQADAAYKRLRDEAEHTPTIATFRAVYRSLTIRTGPDAANGCYFCDGYGWTTVIEHHHGLEYGASKACTNCDAGNDTQRTVAWCNRGAA